VRRGGIAAGLRLGVSAALDRFRWLRALRWNFGDEELLDLLYPLVGSLAGRGVAGRGRGIARVKIALVHDWLTWHARRRVRARALCRSHPDAPIYTRL
jgi:hypothetical protein